MFWADRFAKEITARFGAQKPILIRDEKTLSGRVHVGSLRGVVIHGAIAKALSDAGAPTIYKYEFNDYDPMDDIPSYLDAEQYKQYLGMPLKNIPSPDASAANFAEYFGNELRGVIAEVGFTPEYYLSSELYLSGQMDDCIRTALTKADDIRRIYKEISGGEREEQWLPISVICPTCGKLSTTESCDFDGETLQVHCRVDKVPWTAGCGFEGRVSPFLGKAKLPWKVEWPAKWKVLGVMVEGGGKDHSTKGGARDVANHISKEIFKYEPPFDLPYEFLLIGGQKMASSKGRGSSAREVADLLPPKILRLMLLGKEINQQFNFDPQGDTIPVLYDQFDKLAEHYKAGVKDDYARLFEFLIPPPLSEGVTFGNEVAEFLPRFSQVAFVVQMPHLNLETELEEVKGSPLTDADKKELHERAEYAKRWLSQYAPEKFVFKLQDSLPEAARNLSGVQKKALRALHDYMQTGDTNGEALHHKLHELKTEVPITPAELFSALYFAFLGKSYGPKAGWFLSVLEKDFVLRRLDEAAK